MDALFGPNPDQDPGHQPGHGVRIASPRAVDPGCRHAVLEGREGDHTRVAPTNNACVDAWELRSREATELYHRVLRDGVRFLSRDPRATTTRAGQALSRYFDFLPQLEKMDRARRRGPAVTPGRPDRRAMERRLPAPCRAVAQGVPERVSWFGWHNDARHITS